jgi:hypothetical protein
MTIRPAHRPVPLSQRSPRHSHRVFLRRLAPVLWLLVAVAASVGMAQLHIRVDTATRHAAAPHRSAPLPWSPHGARAWGSRLFDQWPAVRPRRR